MTRSFTRPRRVLVLSLGVALLAAAAPVLAQPGLPESTAEGSFPAQPGVLVAPGLDVAEPDENQPSFGPQHRAQVVGPSGMAFETAPNTFSYYRIIGTAFQPRKSSSDYDYSTNGCMSQIAGSDFRFQAPLLLPDGAVIKYLRIYFLDTAATDMTAWITRYEPGQANLDLTGVQSTGTGGYGTTLSPAIAQVVDTATYAYVLTWATSVLGATNQICGVRVAYYAPDTLSLSVVPETVAAGGTVTVVWTGIPSPHSTDWIGLYKIGAANTAFLAWKYVSCSTTPGGAAAAGTCAFTIPGSLMPGSYELRLLASDGYTVLVTSNGLTVN
jgi:hypothetical protein